MPRVPRIHLEGALYYVTSRGDHNEEIFKDSGDYGFYIELLKKYKEQYKFKLYAYCILPNHLHLLIETGDDVTISQIMHSLNSNYTKYFNGEHRRKGHLFQERYKMVLAEKESFLLSLTSYIHIHPKFLSLVSDISQYPYTSYRSYLYYAGLVKEDTSPVPMEREIKEVMSHLSGKDYRDFVAAIPGSEPEALSKELNKKPVIGPDEFIERVKSVVESEKAKAEELLKRAGRPYMNKKLLVAGGALVLILLVLVSYLYARAIVLRRTFSEKLAQGRAELDKKLTEERAMIYVDLDEKYRADMVSYRAMLKRLEIEKKKADELEKRIKESPKEGK